MSDNSKIVIIKRPKKGHGGAHGGSWKVAYADFVTAMMAFFLLMWLLSMTSPEKRAALSQYFKHFSIFEKSGQSFMEQSSSIFQQSGGEGKSSSVEFSADKVKAASESMRDKLKKAIEDKLQGLKDQVLVDIYEGGVRIQMVDSEGTSMFSSGSAQPSEKAREILKLVAEQIKDSPNRVAVEGHTDASQFAGGGMTNWELSTSRASAARKELELSGIDTSKLARVVGYADTEPLVEEDPKDPRNRRISIILLPEKKVKPKAEITVSSGGAVAPAQTAPASPSGPVPQEKTVAPPPLPSAPQVQPPPPQLHPKLPPMVR